MLRLTLKGLSKAYGKLTVVDQVDLALDEGEFVSLLGPSGCGKTTTLRMIAGFIEPTAGAISVDGQVLSAPGAVVPPERRGMSMIFQSYAIWPHMTVAENVAFGLKLRKLPAAEIGQRVGEMLEVVQLNHLAHRYPAELSGGQQQRVALARAVVVKPSVLLLDEPLSNLDANLREEMRFEIRRLHDEFRITTVYVTHDQGEAMATSDRIAVMNAGRIEQVDAPHLIYTRPRTGFVSGFVGRTNLLVARIEGGDLLLGSVNLGPATRLGMAETRQGAALVSLRPQAMTVLASPPAAGEALVLPAEVRERTYLGEAWDYVVQLDGTGLRLRAAAPPLDAHAVGDRVWLRVDPRQVAVVE